MVARAIACIAAVASAAALAAPPVQPIVVQGLDCRADEAGWRLDATRTTAQFSATTPRKREVIYRGTLQVVAPTNVVWRGDSTHLPRETAVLVAREEACKGGTHKAMLSIRPGEASPGCCLVRAGYDARVAPIANPGAKPPEDWSRTLTDLLPAINACVAKEGARVTAVAGATASAGSVRVRLVETGGAAVECTVDASGRAPAVANVAATPVTGPLFYPLREPPPVVACGKLERVQLRGKDAGYLHYEPC